MSEVSKDKSSGNKHDGVALAVSAAVWGGLFWIIPSDIGFSGPLMWFCYVAGAVCIAVSFGGALMEMENLTGHEAFGWLGVGALFLVGAILLHLANAMFSFTGFSEVATKLLAYGLDMLGIPFILFGVSAITSKPPESEPNDPQKPSISRKDTILTVLSFVSALVPILGAVANNLF